MDVFQHGPGMWKYKTSNTPWVSCERSAVAFC
jgi:hypothetical protein